MPYFGRVGYRHLADVVAGRRCDKCERRIKEGEPTFPASSDPLSKRVLCEKCKERMDAYWASIQAQNARLSDDEWSRRVLAKYGGRSA